MVQKDTEPLADSLVDPTLATICHRLRFEPLEVNNTRCITADEMIFNDDDVALDLSSYDSKYNLYKIYHNMILYYDMTSNSTKQKV